LNLDALTTSTLQDDADAVAKRVCKRPDDFIELMAGNADDCFRMGIRVNRQNVKLFAPFETSDIIVASPLGLKLVLGEVDSKRYQALFLFSVPTSI
jgi:U3 small nucleolar RNA-associated protein 25